MSEITGIERAKNVNGLLTDGQASSKESLLGWLHIVDAKQPFEEMVT